RLVYGLNSFTLLAVPLFVLVGNLMDFGGISKRLTDWAKSLLGWLPGGLGIVTVFSCAIFAALTGSGPATVAAIGAIMMPGLVRSGYPKSTAAGMIAAGGALGPIIPPSLTMALYSSLSEAPLPKLYRGGVPAGLIIAAALFVVCGVMCKRRGYKPLVLTEEEKTTKYKVHAFIDGIWALGAPIIILGGIFGGLCTPTEASVIAVLYSMIVSLFIYKEMKFKDIPGILFDGLMTSARILIIASAATLFATLLTYVNLPQTMLEGLLKITQSQTVMMLIMMGILLVMGMFLEVTPIMYVTVPMFLPICNAMGIDPVYFGILLSINLSLGCATPPFGNLLYAASYVGKVPVMKLGKELMPFIITYIALILLFVFCPQLITFAY
ncbi:MAG: TRAP transporter large permease, partial [Firmicutes bacterium]|nr:TRAP transporter large permease [Bacillota bacterium]